MEKPTKKTSKQPVIRQTKTSIYRMAKANPLLIRENQIKVADKDINLPLAVTFPGRLTLDDIEFRKWVQTSEASKSANSINKKENIPPLKKENIPPLRNVSKEKEPVRKLAKPLLSRNFSLQKKVVQKVPLVKSKSEDIGQIKQELKPTITNKTSDDKTSFKKPLFAAPKAGKLRRSLSSEHFANQSKPTEKCFGGLNETLNKSVSFHNLNADPRKSGLETFSKFLSYRSTSTPMHPTAKLTQKTALDRLQHPLKAWLKGRGKSLSNYQHLKCFGLQQLSEEAKEEEKENMPEVSSKSDSYEDLRIPESPKAVEDQQKAFADNIVTGAVEDLHNIILTGYSPEQCEAWLDFIKQKHRNIEEKPQYWECRAAIEQGRGNIASAVECYKNSIINGANVNQIDESLGQLLAKFSLLNIEAKNPLDAEKKRKAREEEVRNIFKSTIIQFAIKERTLNMKENKKVEEEPKKQFTGTPVRRSTRKSCSKYQHTPGKTLYDSWSDVENSIKDNVEFKNNSYLA